MKGRDERAENLLSRLFAYAPRIGRQALEDYCTEALAWCLMKSDSLLSAFLNLTGIPDVLNWRQRAEVRTQVRFAGTDVNGTDEEATGGRFDLVIESDVTSPFVLVVESKVGSGFGPQQLRHYREKIDAQESFPGVPKKSRFLVTLTTIRYGSPPTVRLNGAITWPEVYSALTGTRAAHEPLVAGLICQFADFLREKGLSMLELKKTDASVLDQWSSIKELEQQLRRIVERLRNQEELKPLVGRRQVKPQGTDWIGVYGKNGFWAGFGILSTDAGPKLTMWIEILVTGDRRKWIKDFGATAKAAFKNPQRYLEINQGHDAVNCGRLTDGNSRFVFAQPVEGTLDGDGEAVFKWLYDMSKYAIALAKRAEKRSE